jgi:hypothetical protein
MIVPICSALFESTYTVNLVIQSLNELQMWPSKSWDAVTRVGFILHDIGKGGVTAANQFRIDDY